MSKSITIIGAGLTGLMCAIQLAQRRFNVDIYEKRTHREICAPKYKLSGQKGRSMSMDISARAIHALKAINAFDYIASASIPMRHKIIHDAFGNTKAFPYGQLPDEHVLTVSRTHLYQTLFDQCQRFNNIRINFGHELTNINPKEKTLSFKNNLSTKTISSETVIGSDGVNSTVREFVQKLNEKPFQFSLFPMSYKELTIPKDCVGDLDINAMHMWPRNGMMLVAQPNIDLSFTCALLMPETGELSSFTAVDSKTKIRELFNTNFFDVTNQMPYLESEYITNPIGKLKIVMGSSWRFSNFVILIGDAAHGMVPFFGQGVNCSFEDCTFLLECLDKSNNDWSNTFDLFDKIRVSEANAINAMSYENYPELFTNSDLSRIELIREIEAMLSTTFLNKYRTYHNLVCFDRVPYTLARKIKTLQVTILKRLSKNITSITQIDKHIMDKEIAQYQSSLAKLRSENREYRDG